MYLRLIKEIEHQGVKHKPGSEWHIEPDTASVSKDGKTGHIVSGYGTTIDVEIGKDAILV